MVKENERMEMMKRNVKILIVKEISLCVKMEEKGE
jgi:hypothetical protein